MRKWLNVYPESCKGKNTEGKLKIYKHLHNDLKTIPFTETDTLKVKHHRSTLNANYQSLQIYFYSRTMLIT